VGADVSAVADGGAVAVEGDLDVLGRVR